MAPNTLPAMAKSTANYANSQLIKMEALADGYSEGIALDVSGNISEGSGQNIFVVRDDAIFTPPLSASILGGITRDSVITLARELGFNVVETDLPREIAVHRRRGLLRRHGGRGDADSRRSTRSRSAPAAAVRSPRPFSGHSSTSSTARSADTHGWLTYVYPEEKEFRAAAAAHAASR